MPNTDSHSAKRRTYCLGHFQARATSGLSVNAYTAKHQLSSATYYAASKGYGAGVGTQSAAMRANSSSAPRFARVVANRPCSADDSRYRVHAPGGIAIDVVGSLDDLFRVVNALRASA